MKENERRKFTRVVNRSLQYRFLAMMMIYFIILILFFGITLFLPDILQMQNEDLSIAIRGAAAERMLFKHIWVWPLVLLLSAFMGLHSFRSFQRVAGPLYRFRWAFEQIRNGNLGLVVKIRNKDYLHLEEDSLNDMLRALEDQINLVKKRNRDTQESFEQLKNKIKEDITPNQEQEKYFRLHNQYLQETQEALEYFKLGNETEKYKK